MFGLGYQEIFILGILVVFVVIVGLVVWSLVTIARRLIALDRRAASKQNSPSGGNAP